MRHGLFKRSLSIVLALVMILGNVPVNALATETGETTAPTCEHSYESVVTDATCTEGGYTTHTCSLCGDTYTDGEFYRDGVKVITNQEYLEKVAQSMLLFEMDAAYREGVNSV